MTRLTPPMRAALQEARRLDGLRRTHDPTKPGKPPWPAHASTLAALVRHELLKRVDGRNRRGWPRTTWTITDAGQQALQPPDRHINDKPTYLARPSKNTGDYTHDPRRRIDDLEVMTEPDDEWNRAAQRRGLSSQDKRTVARRLARNARAA